MRNRTSDSELIIDAPHVFQVSIEQIVPGGSGLGRIDGRVVLVPLTAVGDVVTVRSLGSGPQAQLVSVVEPGAGRVEAPCPYYGLCGGCDFMHLEYGAQLEAKLGMIDDALWRTGRFEDVPEIEIEPNPEPFGSRIRATWNPSPSGKAGYLRRGSKEVFEIDRCLVLDPALEATRREISISTPVQALAGGETVSLAGGDRVPEAVEFTVLGEAIRASANVFFQANTALLDRFVGYVIETAEVVTADQVADLYSGVGLFTLPLARRAGQIEAIEKSKDAVRLARENAQRANLSNITFHPTPVETWIGSGWRLHRADVVIVDPPRIGLSKIVCEGLRKVARDRLIYVSCDSVTFARDARMLVDAGYQFTSLKAFDMFPQTHHVELVARFDFGAH